MTLNQMTVTAKLKRIEICDLMLACTMAADSSNSEKWDILHDKLEGILREFDEKHGY